MKNGDKSIGHGLLSNHDSVDGKGGGAEFDDFSSFAQFLPVGENVSDIRA